MAEYITFAEYSETKGIEPLATGTFESLALFAKDIVDGYTFGIIESQNLADDAHYRPRIVRAMALIIDSLSRADLSELLGGESEAISSKSESVGGYSYSVSYRGKNENAYPIPMPPLAKILLMPIKALGRCR